MLPPNFGIFGNLTISLYTNPCYIFHWVIYLKACTSQKMKFSMKDFFSKCDQIRRFLRI